jgi:Ornithine/acetylornithine aminotransferase
MKIKLYFCLSFLNQTIMLTNRQLFQRNLGLPANVDDPWEIVKANNIYMYDADGKEYIDMVSGVSVSNVGHLHPKVVDAIKDQLEKYMHLMVYGDFVEAPQVQLAKLLCDQLPNSLDAVYFVNSGSEAIEGAIKLAKRITGKTELFHFDNAYHGGTTAALSMMGREYYKKPYRPLLPGTHELKFNDVDQLSEISENAFAVVMEPVQSEAGVIIPKKGFLEAVRKRCNEVGAMLIFDEVQMGFGRTGSLFSFQKFGVTPDILCLAKAMGGGMPIGAFISSKQKMNLLTFDPVLGHITTFGGHPVCCAAGLASLQLLLENDWISTADEKGKYLKDKLITHPLVKEIRQVGLFLGIDIDEKIHTGDLLHKFRENGLLGDLFLFRDHAFRIAPPLLITHEQLDEILHRVILTLNILQ